MPKLRATGAGVAAGALPILAVLAGCGSAPAPPPPPPTAAPTPPAGSLTPEQAGRTATERFGGRVLGVEPDTANGEPTWEVEIADSRQGRIEVDVAQGSGAIVEMERD